MGYILATKQMLHYVLQRVQSHPNFAATSYIFFSRADTSYTASISRKNKKVCQLF